MTANHPPSNDSAGASQLDELLCVYALDAVEAPERAQVEAYLLSNADARDEVDGHHEVAALLAVGTTDAAPDAPAGLWDRISEAIDDNPITEADAQQKEFPELSAPAATRQRPGDVPTSSGEGSASTSPALSESTPGGSPKSVLPPSSASQPNRARRIGAPLLAAAAALLLIGGFLAGRVLSSSNDGAPSVEERASAIFDDPDARSVSLISEADDTLVVPAAFGADDIGYLDGSTLPELPNDRTYQLWAIYDDDDVVSLGVLGNDPGIKTFLADEDLSVLVVTEEVRGGVTSSANGAVVAGEI